MSEFIINNDQLERLIEAVEHDTKMPVNEVIIKGVRLSELVRCRDCTYITRSEAWPGALDCKRTGLPTGDDCFCAWGERREG